MVTTNFNCLNNKKRLQVKGNILQCLEVKTNFFKITMIKIEKNFVDENTNEKETKIF